MEQPRTSAASSCGLAVEIDESAGRPPAACGRRRTIGLHRLGPPRLRVRSAASASLPRTEPWSLVDACSGGWNTGASPRVSPFQPAGTGTAVIAQRPDDPGPGMNSRNSRPGPGRTSGRPRPGPRRPRLPIRPVPSPTHALPGQGRASGMYRVASSRCSSVSGPRRVTRVASLGIWPGLAPGLPPRSVSAGAAGRFGLAFSGKASASTCLVDLSVIASPFTVHLIVIARDTMRRSRRPGDRRNAPDHVIEGAIDSTSRDRTGVPPTVAGHCFT